MAYSIETRDILSRKIGEPKPIVPASGKPVLCKEEKMLVGSHFEVISPNQIDHIRTYPGNVVERKSYFEDDLRHVTHAPSTTRLRFNPQFKDGIKSLLKLITIEQIVWTKDSE